MDKEIEEKTLKILKKQLENNFEELSKKEKIELQNSYKNIIKKLENMFFYITVKNYNNFSPFHSAQYGYMLYFLANDLYKKMGINILSDKLYLLNKMINSIDLYYAVEMPKIFFLGTSSWNSFR